jgi:hypothetical protein
MIMVSNSFFPLTMRTRPNSSLSTLSYILAHFKLKRLGIMVGVVLLVLGGGVGLATWQTQGIIVIPMLVFSVAAVLLGFLFLWLA